MTQHMTDEAFVDYWFFILQGATTESLYWRRNTSPPTFVSACLPLERITNGMFKNCRCARLSGISVVIKLVAQPSNSANVKETWLFIRNGTGTAIATTDGPLTWCLQNLALRAEKPVYESDAHLQLLINPVRYLSHGYSVVPIVADLSLATARPSRYGWGTSSASTRMCSASWFGGAIWARAPPYDGADGRLVRYLQDFWLTTPTVYTAGKSDGVTGYRVFRNNKLILDETGHDQRMMNWARSTHRRHGVQRVSDCHRDVFINAPTTIDLCPSAGHGVPGKSGDSHVLGGISTDQAGEFLIEMYLAA